MVEVLDQLAAELEGGADLLGSVNPCGRVPFVTAQRIPELAEKPPFKPIDIS